MSFLSTYQYNIHVGRTLLNRLVKKISDICIFK